MSSYEIIKISKMLSFQTDVLGTDIHAQGQRVLAHAVYVSLEPINSVPVGIHKSLTIQKLFLQCVVIVLTLK